MKLRLNTNINVKSNNLLLRKCQIPLDSKRPLHISKLTSIHVSLVTDFILFDLIFASEQNQEVLSW